MSKQKVGLTPISMHRIIAVFFGSGCVPVAPGTFGTLAAIPLYLLIAEKSLIAYCLVTCVVIVVGIWAAGRLSSEIGTHDHGAIVVDEVAGYLITMMFIPFSWTALLCGFFLFRFFDILKPWPIGWIDKHVHGGSGIMVDDLIAGVFANIVLLVLLKFPPIDLF